MERKVILSKRCFKIDKSNAKAMIFGFEKDEQTFHQAIYCDVVEKPFPMLITLNRSPTKFQLSQIGFELNAESPYNKFSIPYKYIVLLDSVYPIKNDLRLWERVCNNGLFDIWDPSAPFKRFNDSVSLRNKIILLRIYEIYEEFDEIEIEPVSDRIDHITSNRNLEVTLKNPVINDEEFKKIKELLENSLKDYTELKPDSNSIKHLNHKIKERPIFESPQTLYEHNLENILAERLNDIEDGLALIKRQYQLTTVGRIDLFCKDKNGDLVVIEIKKYGAPNYSIIDQITRYIGYVKEKIAKSDQKVRGIIIVGQKDEKLEYSVKAIPNLEVKTFKFTIE